jgi:HAD superfamily hydrolase (TIGR01484 family)
MLYFMNNYSDLMKKYKAIVSDFDGTLVDHTHELPPIARDAIKKFVKSGGIFSIATGRAYQGAVQKT